jgi:hypothetical protein
VARRIPIEANPLAEQFLASSVEQVVVCKVLFLVFQARVAAFDTSDLDGKELEMRVSKTCLATYG